MWIYNEILRNENQLEYYYKRTRMVKNGEDFMRQITNDELGHLGDIFQAS